MEEFSLKTRAHAIQPTLQIGKNGLTEGQLNELKNQLKTRKLVKIKILRSVSNEKDEMKDKILEETKAKLIMKTGNVLVLYKR